MCRWRPQSPIWSSDLFSKVSLLFLLAITMQICHLHATRRLSRKSQMIQCLKYVLPRMSVMWPAWKRKTARGMAFNGKWPPF